MCGVECVADLHNPVLKAGSDVEFISLHVEDEVGPDRLREVLEAKCKHKEQL